MKKKSRSKSADTRVRVKIPNDLYSAIVDYASDKGIPVNDFIQESITRFAKSKSFTKMV